MLGHSQSCRLIRRVFWSEGEWDVLGTARHSNVEPSMEPPVTVMWNRLSQ
jgi:hypothetical protein